MTATSAISTATIQAYRTTHFVVKGPTPFVLHIGIKSSPLLSLYGETECDCCAYLTACNPYSEALSDSANAKKQARLERDLETQGWRFFLGLGEHPSGDWPGEPSFLVLGMSREEGKAFGARYEQNAIVWCGADAVPELVVLR